jgi:hypothetical protein
MELLVNIRFRIFIIFGLGIGAAIYGYDVEKELPKYEVIDKSYNCTNLKKRH